MLFHTITGFALLSLTTASAIAPRAGCGEGTQKICYGVDGGTSQNIDPEDVQYVAEYLRSLSAENEGKNKFWTMPKSIDCAEWSLPVFNAGTVLALVKHIDNRVLSSVLFEDLAMAIDGGKNAADKGKNELLGCGRNGGQVGVTANTSNPLYNSADYKSSGAKPTGLVIKLVKAPAT
ncbi:hypothetical protein CCM_01697 [Cordyceps militaris CM01]|uniref:Uncharacterized protein n=1 Tax=Cordyceps militaris (strain CM01) TaxID=983644 RepID=G3J6L0_CORMM|nr:uncharacterized protein CCM_01697 [Cordyceps militaris CM01]EGX97038.1 hypothetical protein CCM_01697 [Cordyceps militaris CM01]